MDENGNLVINELCLSVACAACILHVGDLLGNMLLCLSVACAACIGMERSPVVWIVVFASA